MRRNLVATGVLAFVVGVVVGGYLFVDSKPRSFLALGRCVACYRPNDLAGLLASAGIQRTPGLIPRVVRETDHCLAIQHPFPEARFHFVVFPKKDIKNLGEVALGDEPYVMDCLGVIRSLILEYHLKYYRVLVNGPGLQDVTYLHFHLKSNEASSGRSGAADTSSHR